MKLKGIVLTGFAALIMACGGTSGSSDKSTAAGPDGEKLYKLNCVICHGGDGKLGVNGSKDITVSPLTMDERVTLITEGKGLMTPFKDVLSAKEIKAVAKYTFKL